MAPEKRKDIRKEYAHEIGFELMLVGGQERDVVPGYGFAVDIGDGGIGLMTRYEPKEGEVLKLFIPLIEPEVALPVFAEVMWVTPVSEYYRTGLRFLA